ncbi:MAG: hypothetical protein Q9209_006755 [Squamulea sp. 1 TL-2023]
MIQPGLARIHRLLEHSHVPWRAVHVAGTNGKGSVCAYVSAMLHAANIKVGRFTSPHLIDRWDCITIEEKVIDESKFRKVEHAVKLRDSAAHIEASEFELLTATAFELFTQEKIQVGVVEVGVGGRQDATNIIHNPLATVITKIGKDHQSLLGTTIEDIASHKAGIIKPGVACVVDATNQGSVLQVLEATAQHVGAKPLHRITNHVHEESTDLQKYLADSDLESHQMLNLRLGYHAAMIAAQHIDPPPGSLALLEGARRACWPGRLQTLDLRELTGRKEPVVVDGAHNAQSAAVLGSYVNKRVRTESRPVTWIVGASIGKELQELFSSLFQFQDNIVAVEFGPVDGMPWVSPVSSASILKVARSLAVKGSLQYAGQDVFRALQLATETAAGDPIVIGGSLYLVSDVLRLLRDSECAKVSSSSA